MTTASERPGGLAVLSRLRTSPEQDRTAALRRWLIIAIPTLAAFGPQLPVVHPFYAFRIAAVVLLVVSLAAPPRPDSFATTLIGRASTWTALVWLACGVLTTLWAADKVAAARDLLAVGCGLAVVVGVGRSGTAKDLLRWLATGWVVAFVVTAVIGTVEVTTHHHLSNYVLAPYLEQGRGEELSASTFGNPNAYALFLAMGAPVLLHLVTVSRSAKEKTCYVLLGLWLLAMLLYTGGRLGIATTVISVAVWLVCTRRALRSAAGLTILLGVILLVSSNVWSAYAEATHLPAPPQKMADFNAHTIHEVSASADTGLNSGNVRLNLVRNGWDMVLASRGLGVGPGNFPVWLEDHGTPYPVGGVYSPHNAVVEVASQYGVLTLLVTFALFALTVWVGGRKGFRPRLESGTAGTLVLSLAAGFPLAAVCSSSFWDLPFTWVIVTVFVVAGAVAGSAVGAATDADGPAPVEDRRDGAR